MNDPAAAAAALVPPAAGGGVIGLATRTAAMLWPYGDTAPDRAADAGDRFGISSITKSITATQTLIAGVPLELPLAELVPGFDQPEVTTLHVLSHTSGLSEAANSAENPARAALPAPEHLAIALAARLDFVPGSDFRYSSPGFWLLAEALRRHTGLDHVDHLRHTICERLGLHDFGYSPATVPPRYVPPRPGRERGLHQEDTRRCAYPAGGVSATGADLLRFGLALSDLVDLDELSRPRSAGHWLGHRVRWATGWELGGPGELRSDTALYCSGGSGCALWVDPGAGLAACVLSAGWALPRTVIGELGDILWRQV